MLFTRYKCGNKWKVVKTDKNETNTNKTSASSMPSKVLLPVNLQNRFSSQMVTEESSVEHESQVQTPTKDHQHVDIWKTE